MCSLSTGGGFCGSLNQDGCSTAYSLPRKEGNQRSGSMAMSAGGWQGCSPTHVNDAVWSCALYIIITNELLCIYAPRPSSRVCSSSVGLSSTSVPPVDFVPPNVAAVSVLLSTVRWMSNVCIAPSYHQPVCFPSNLSAPVTT